MFTNVRITLDAAESLISAIDYKRQSALSTLKEVEGRKDLSEWEKQTITEAKETLAQIEIIEKALMKHIKETL